MAETSTMTAYAEGENEMSLTVRVREIGNAVILDLSGRITIGEGATVLRDEVRGMLDGGHRNILLNLAEVSYIDSSGLGQLVGSFATVAHRGGQLKLLNLGKKIHELMQITKLYSVFEAHTSESAALRSFHSTEYR
jgi:anti-sigma B factor antagonist